MTAATAKATPVGGTPPDPRETCPNCGSEGGRRYCPDCGQDQRDPRRSPAAWLEDVVSEELGMDARVPRTLHALLLRPGFLAEEWVGGRRARYVSPSRLFVVAAAVAFAVTFLLGLPFGDLERPALGPRLGTTARDFAVDAIAGYMQTVMTLCVFLLVPLFALWLRLAHVRTEKVLADHFVFSFHQHAVLLLLVTVAWPLLFLKPWGMWAGIVLILAAAPHTVLAYRRFYPGRWRMLRSIVALSGWTLAFSGGVALVGYAFLTVSNAGLDPLAREFAVRLHIASYRDPGNSSPEAQRVLRMLALESIRRVDQRYLLDSDAYRVADLEVRLGETTDSTLVWLEEVVNASGAGPYVLSRGLATVLRAERGDTALARAHARRFLEVAASQPVPEDSPFHTSFLEYLARAEEITNAVRD